MKKVLLLGSGALKIGQAGEFDYSGSQALKALKEEGISTVLVNPNIATIQTSPELADKIYFLPVTPYFIEKIIQKEKVDGILLSFGGQTALNCGMELDKTGVLKKLKVKVLGTPVKSIELTEDRELFAGELNKIDVKVPAGDFARTLPEAKKIAKRLGFPLMIRSGFSLGGLGSSVVTNDEEFLQIVTVALKNAPQITIEEYLKHWKEIEYEIVRDAKGNKITVCNMENFDPLGVHTGESIVVAPSQTLNNYQYHKLREISLKVIEHLGIVGECNIQFALNPENNDYRVIEVNARLSRSSALASKATGYPLAYIGAKIGLGYLLPDLQNSVTKSTSAFFEPALDYLVVKIPRWDLKKFTGSEKKIGSEMKSVGEVMAIGRSFPEALQKAVRMLEIGQDGLIQEERVKDKVESVLTPNTERLFILAKEIYKGAKIEQLYQETGIDHWFLHQLKEIVNFEKKIKQRKIKKTDILEGKKLGFSDKVIGKGLELSEVETRELRKKLGILPKVKHIDTLAAEYPAQTNYLYLTYHGEESELENLEVGSEKWEVESLKSRHQEIPLQSQKHLTSHLKNSKAIVLGSGPYRIGSSVEFDWCSVTAAKTLRENNVETIIVNCNPETVSTDFDSADKLYFEELTFERVRDIYDIEEEACLVLAFGGQVPNNLAIPAFKSGMRILGTSPESIDRAENREKFSDILDKIEVNQPRWRQLKTVADALKFGKEVGFPVLVRPSYVLSGSAMNVASNPRELEQYLSDATQVSPEHPVVISKFISNAKEIEIDGVASNGQLIIYALSEHIENAGVHSGDATIVLPPQRLYLETIRQIKHATKKILEELKITGPFNIQFMAKDNKIMVIELNLRASRSFPFVSKVTGYNFAEIATKVMLGQEIKGDFKTVDLDFVGVKAPQFSFNRIKGVDPKLRVEMASTGEVACFGEDQDEAYLKALLSTGWEFPKKNIFLSIGGSENKIDFLSSAKKLYQLGYKLFATDKTATFLKENKVPNTRLFKISEKKNPSILDLLSKGQMDLVINISVPDDHNVASEDGFLIRRTCIDFGIPLVTNLQSAIALSSALFSKKIEDLEIKSWDEYVQITKV